MDPVYSKTSADGKCTYAEILYGKFRCGLAHGLSIEGHEVATRIETYILDEDGYVSVDLWGLCDDVERASRRYITRVQSDGLTRANFVKRFDQIFVHPY